MADQNILVTVGSDISNLTSGLNTASNQVSNFVSDTRQGFQALGDLGKVITGFGLAVAAGLGGAVMKAADFDTAIRKAGAIAGASAKELDDMKAAALDMGATTSKSASEVANAMTELAAKGFDANQTIAAMPGIIKAAEASGEDLALVSDTVTSALNAFRMEASEANKVADIMTMTANKSAAGIGDMQYAFKYAAPAAAQLGISMEELAAATGIMANAGIKGETAGTTLRMAMLRLVKPPKQAQKALDKLGIAVTDQNGKFKSLQTLIGELQVGMEGMTEAQKMAAIGAIFGAESMSGMMTLIGNGPEALGEFTKALEESAGMAAKTAEQMKAGIGGALERLKGSIESLVISIGDQLVPYVIKMADFLAKVVNKFNGLSDATKKFLVVGAALASIFALFIGPMLIIIGFIPSIVAGFGAIATMFGVTSMALLKIVAIAGGVVTVILLIVSALVIAYNEVEWFRNGVNAAWAWIVNAAKVTGEAIKTAFGASIVWLAQKFGEFKEVGAATFASIGAWASGAFAKVSSIFGPILSNIIDKIIGFGGQAKEAFGKAMNLDFSGVAELAVKFLPTLIGYLLGGIPRLIIIGVNIIKAIADGMGLTVPELMTKVVESITGMIDTFVANLPMFLEAGVQLITSILDGILSQIPTLIGFITQLINTFAETITTVLPKLTTAGTQILTTLVLGIVVALPQLITAAIEIFTTLINAIIAALPIIINAGIEVLMALVGGILQALPVIIEAGFSLVTSLIDGIISMLPKLIEVALLLIMSVVQLLIENLPAIVDAGVQILMALIGGLIKILPILIDTAIMLVFAIVGALIANLPAILNAGVKLVMALISGLIKIIPMLIQTAVKLAVSILKAIIQHLPQILSAGAQLVFALIKGLVSIIGQLISTAFSIGSTIVREIGKVDLWQVGKDIISGLIRGIGSMASAVWNKAKEIASGVTNSIKKALNIHSPSRVMMELGVYTGEGFAKGIDSMIRKVQGVTSDMANAALPETSTLSLAYETPSMGALAVKSAGSFELSQQSAENSRPILITNVFEVDGVEVARLTEPHLDTMQTDKFNLRARMGGLRR
jgi:TP901 family phage tail tape measure protein